MWVYVLVVTIVSFVPGELDIHVQAKGLMSYPTLEECNRELRRVTNDMALSYPGHTDYRLTCERQEAKSLPKDPERMF